MPKEEWGVKHICPTTGKRFYDLNKKPIISPYTGETLTLDANTRTHVAAVEKVEAKEEPAEDDADILLDDDDTNSEDLGDDLLDDSDDNDEDTVSLDEVADVAANEDDS